VGGCPGKVDSHSRLRRGIPWGAICGRMPGSEDERNNPEPGGRESRAGQAWPQRRGRGHPWPEGRRPSSQTVGPVVRMRAAVARGRCPQWHSPSPSASFLRSRATATSSSSGLSPRPAAPRTRSRRPDGSRSCRAVLRLSARPSPGPAPGHSRRCRPRSIRRLARHPVWSGVRPFDHERSRSGTRRLPSGRTR
jgi:hypothetical protein